MSRLLLALAVALLLWPLGVSAETSGEYRDALAGTLRAAEEALSALPANVSLAEYPPLRLALQRLESIDHVTTDSGAVVAITNRSLGQRFRGSRSEGRQARDELRQLLEAIDASASQTDWTKDSDVRAALDQVLARPEFHSSAVNSADSFLDDLRTRLFRWLEGLLPNISLPQLPGVDLGKPAVAVFWVVTGALAIFALAFLAFTWRSGRQILARSAALRSGSPREREDARTARLAAQQAADAGEYRLAIHFLYLWTILHLAEESRLRYDRSLTNREQLRAIAEGGEVADLLNTAADDFDGIWYGHATCTAAEYGQFRRTVERIVGVAT